MSGPRVHWTERIASLWLCEWQTRRSALIKNSSGIKNVSSAAGNCSSGIVRQLQQGRSGDKQQQRLEFAFFWQRSSPQQHRAVYRHQFQRHQRLQQSRHASHATRCRWLSWQREYSARRVMTKCCAVLCVFLWFPKILSTINHVRNSECEAVVLLQTF